MKNLFSVYLIALSISFSSIILASAQSKEIKPAQAKQPTFIYMLRLLPEYHKEANWSPEAQKLVGAHFNQLKQLTKEGTVIMAGRTDYAVENQATFGIVVFYAKDLEAARALMESDPAVKGKVMTAEVHPFSLALIQGQKLD